MVSKGGLGSQATARSRRVRDSEPVRDAAGKRPPIPLVVPHEPRVLAFVAHERLVAEIIPLKQHGEPFHRTFPKRVTDLRIDRRFRLYRTEVFSARAEGIDVGAML